MKKLAADIALSNITEALSSHTELREDINTIKKIVFRGRGKGTKGVTLSDVYAQTILKSLLARHDGELDELAMADIATKTFKFTGITMNARKHTTLISATSDEGDD